MTPEERKFVDGILPLLPREGSQSASLSPEERAFVTGFLEIANTRGGAGTLSTEERRFVDGFCALASELLPSEGPEAEFERVVMAGWQSIVWRIEGALSAGMKNLDPAQVRALRMLEDTPSLLAPLGKARDERSHSELLGWALRLREPLGRGLRRAFLKALRLGHPDEGWLVVNESPLGPGCRVDLEIAIPGRWRCFVEVKVDAEERDDQLDDYRKRLDDRCKSLGVEGTLVFLTLDGRRGACKADHERLSFERLLAAWLPLAARPEPEALYLRLWLSTIAQELCGVSQPGPVFNWDFSRRIGVFGLLERLGGIDG